MLSSSRVLSMGFLIVSLWLLIGFIHLQHFQFDLAEDERLKGFPRYDSNLSKDEFVAAAISSAADDGFDYSHIRNMCDNQEWDNTVVFSCHGVLGGIGNIRQELLHCIRYAIDAGAGFLLPVINLRAETDLSNLESGTAPMSYLFDEDRFISRLRTACPQMPVYKDIEELEKIGPVTETELINPKKLPHWPTLPAYSARARVDEIKASTGQISLIPLEKVWRYFPICHDTVGIADTLGNLLPFRKDIYRIAATILYELHSRFQLPINPHVTTTLPYAGTFLGIHLRTASDILPSWLKYTDQASYYLSRIESSEFLSSLPVIYLASGNATSVKDFTTETRSLSYPKQVVTKHDLVSSDAERDELENLTWDQQALIDYLVLSRSAFFMGMTDSSFAWTIAVQRRKSTKAGTCGFRSGWWKSQLLGAALRDEFSDLVGNHGYGWESRMWP